MYGYRESTCPLSVFNHANQQVYILLVSVSMWFVPVCVCAGCECQRMVCTCLHDVCVCVCQGLVRGSSTCSVAVC